MTHGTQFTIELIRNLFNYDPETGYITRIVSYGRALTGQVFCDANNVSVLGVPIRPARLAWALHNGAWPPDDMFVDHINGIKADNRIVNLRLATPTQNQYNKAATSFYPKGVTWRNRLQKPWQAKIRVNGTRYHLGSFETMEEAAEAYRKAALEHHGDFACLE